jgi:hypothetical protein
MNEWVSRARPAAARSGPAALPSSEARLAVPRACSPVLPARLDAWRHGSRVGAASAFACVAHLAGLCLGAAQHQPPTQRPRVQAAGARGRGLRLPAGGAAAGLADGRRRHCGSRRRRVGPTAGRGLRSVGGNGGSGRPGTHARRVPLGLQPVITACSERRLHPQHGQPPAARAAP